MIEPPMPSEGAPVIKWALPAWRFMRAIRPKAGPGILLTETPSGTIISTRPGNGRGGAQSLALNPSLSLEAEDWKLAVSPGLSESIPPDFGTGTVASLPAPTATVTAATQLWLVLEWEPGSESAEGVYWISSGGSLVSAGFELSATRPAETAAAVDEAGTITNGIYAILWATIVASASGFAITAKRSGNHQLTFCAPDSLKLLFD